METDFNFYLFVAWSIFLVFYNSFVKSNIKSPPSSSYWKKIESKITFFCLLFLFFALISGLFSHQLPLFFEKYLFYLFSIVIFLFFIKAEKNLLSKDPFVEYLLLLTAVLNIFVLFLTFYSNSRNLFQGTNLLVRSYGHNHYAAFLILVLPLIWSSILNRSSNHFLHNKLNVFLNLFLLVSSYLLILLSLARWALFIVIIQFIVIFLQNKNAFYNLQKKKILYFLIRILILFFLSLAVVIIFLSLPLSVDDNNICSLKIYRKDPCISITENSRIYYWRQAWLLSKNYPIFGYGLGTFKNAAKLFPIVNEQHSAYAHNIFLHNFSEMGILGGGFFLLLIIYIFQQSLQLTQKSKNSSDKFLFIAAVSSLVNAMFDFDWHFFAIFVLTLIFLAYIIRDHNDKRFDNKTSNYWQILIICLFVISTFFSVIKFLTNNWQDKNNKYLIKYSAMINVLDVYFEEKSPMMISDYQSLYKFYRYDPGFILEFLSLNELDQEIKMRLYLDLAEINPTAFISMINFREWDINEAQIISEVFTTTLHKHKMLDNYFFLSYWERKDLAQELFDLADEAFQINNWELTNHFYQTAYLLDPYIFSTRDPLFLEENEIDKLMQLLPYLSNIHPFNIKNFDRYMYLYGEVVTELFKQNLLEEFENMTISMIEHDPNAKWHLINHLFNLVENGEQRLILEEIEKQY